MKKIVLILIIFIAAQAGVAAQNLDLKGPAAKNSKPWNNQAKKESVLVSSNIETRQGPSFKNSKAWSEDRNDLGMFVYIDKKERITGPKAKNSKPWKKN